MMEYKGYHADVKYSDEDKLFIGEVIGLNDTLTTILICAGNSERNRRRNTEDSLMSASLPDFTEQL